jgi:ferritin
MEISEQLYSAFQAQYNVELTNADFYQALSHQAEALTWEGFSKWLAKASGEERDHAQAFRDFLIDRNRTPRQSARPEQKQIGEKPLDWMALSLQAEQENTKRIYALYKLCMDSADYDACVFLHPYLTEQRVSERELVDWIQQLKRSGSNAADLQLDEKAGGA